MKRIYITPNITSIVIQQPLLYDVSGDDKKGEGWGGEYAKRGELEFDEFDFLDEYDDNNTVKVFIH